MDSDSLNLAFIDFTFSAIGDDERIHQLNKITKRRLYGAKRRVSDYYSIGLKLGKAIQEKNALRVASAWLQTHSKLLKSLDARKKIELNTCFGRDDGSRILTLEPDFCAILLSVDCAFSHQASQWLGPRAPRLDSR